MKQEKQTELLRTQQMLNEVNRKLLMTLGVAEVFPWKWELAEHMVWFDARPSDDPAGWEIFHNDSFPVSIARVYQGIYKEDRLRVIEACRGILKGKMKKVVVELRFWAKKREGSVLEWLEMHAIPGKVDENGRLLTVEGSLMSITRQKVMEEELTAAKEKAEEANRLKSALIANMNHEIRTPLNAIVGFASLLSIIDDEKEQQEYIGLIQSNTEHLLRLMNDVIDLSNIESGVMDIVGSDVVLDSLMKEMELTYVSKAETNNLVLAWDREQSNGHIYTDRDRLIQILEHLLDNAIKFTTKGTVRWGYQEKENGQIRFYVTDTGCGIPNDKKEVIFERFVKLDSFTQGLGLGLSLCKIIIERMHGAIGVESEVGEGSTFWFTIPNLSDNHI